MKKKNDKAEAHEYVLCPKCELNYMTKKQRCCDICAAALRRDGETRFFPDEDEELEKLCPVCKINYMNPDDEMCFMCQKDAAERPESETDESWRNFVDDDEPDPFEPLDISFEELAKEEEELEEETEENTEPDFEYVDPDEVFGDDYDEDEDEEDEGDEEDGEE